MFKNRFVKILIITLSILTFVLGLGAGCNKPEEQPKVQSYVMSALRKTIGLESEYQLSIIGLEEGKAAVWSSNNVSVATVSANGLVKGVGIGQSLITARVGDKILECEIIVDVILEEVLQITLPKEVDDSITLLVGDSYTFVPELSDGSTQAQFTISSSSNAVTVDGLTITAKSAAENVEITIACNVEGVAPIIMYVTIA